MYSSADIEKQIWNFERVKVSIPDKTLKFKRKWSEVFNTALPNDTVINSFKDRFHLFCTS
ncbi:MAG: hypothetical protein ACD_33C00036G0007 [uncultured bacterium]|nr:MAG: hypothetical protein ACD_33C00036G0007 [uncultured bacterium]